MSFATLGLGLTDLGALMMMLLLLCDLFNLNPGRKIASTSAILQCVTLTKAPALSATLAMSSARAPSTTMDLTILLIYCFQD